MKNLTLLNKFKLAQKKTTAYSRCTGLGEWLKYFWRIFKFGKKNKQNQLSALVGV